MSKKQTEAQQILTNGLLGDLFATYSKAQYDNWLDAKTMEAQVDIRARARGARDFMLYIENKCGEVVNGH